MLRALKKIRIRWPLAVLGLFYLYLGFHALSGEQGILSWSDYKDRIESLEADIASTSSQRESLELTAKQLRAEHLDLDVLDVEARTMLNVSQANEIVIWLDETP